VLANGDEARFLEHLEVLRDALLGDVEVLSYLADGARLVADELQHRAAAGVGKRTEDGIGAHRGLSVAASGPIIKPWLVKVSPCILPRVKIESMFERVAERLLSEDRALEQGRMFGSVGLKTGGKVFAMVVKGDLVVKLPANRVDELLEARTGRPFEPGHGRAMKQWVSLRPPDDVACEAYVREARTFVASASR
jgi:TfoX N-terminal domain